MDCSDVVFLYDNKGFDLNLIPNTLTTLATIGLVIAAFWAFKTWRDEFLGKKKIDIACQIVESACNIKDLLSYVRNGATFTNEHTEILNELKNAKEQNEDVQINENKIHYLVPRYRINKETDMINNFLSLKNKAQLYWDDEILRLFSELNGIIHKVNISSKMLYSYSEGENRESIRRWESDIWSTVNENDELFSKVQSIIAEFKLNLEPLYKDQRTQWKKLNS